MQHFARWYTKRNFSSLRKASFSVKRNEHAPSRAGQFQSESLKIEHEKILLDETGFLLRTQCLPLPQCEVLGTCLKELSPYLCSKNTTLRGRILKKFAFFFPETRQTHDS